MKVNDSGGQHFDLSKELENINFRVLRENQLDDGTNEGRNEMSIKQWIYDEKKPDDDGKSKIKNQFTSFQKATRMLIIWGQCIGVNPVTGILQKDVSKMRFTIYSWKFLFAIIVAFFEGIGTILCIYRLFRYSTSINSLVFLIFFMAACSTTVLFIWIASKWPILMKELINARLDDYIDSNISKKCNIACGIFIGLAVTEYAISILSRVSRIYECSANATEETLEVGEVFIKVTSPWLHDLNVPNVESIGFLIQCLNLIATAAWNYADIFIVCMSLYLTSILEQINKKIVLTASKNYVSATTWNLLREDYTRATNLVKQFDDMFSGVVLVTIANDLLNICLQLYNVFSNGVNPGDLNTCPEHVNSLFRTYMYPTYLMYSIVYLFIRFLTVALVASGLNTASMLPAPVLYTVPTTSYCIEVERFLHQVNSDMVAFSGLHFFYVTRDLILTVAGTIVTYELVLLQFSIDDMNKY